MSRLRAIRFAWDVLPRAERRLMGLELVVGGALGLLGTAPPLLIRSLIDSVLPSGDTGALVELVFVGAALYGSLALLGIIDQWLQSRITEGLGRALRDRFFNRLTALPFGFFVNGRSGEISSRLTVDIRTAQGIIRDCGSIVTTFAMFVATLAVMLWLSSAVTLLALIVVPLVAGADRAFSDRIARRSGLGLAANSALTSYVTERSNPGGALLLRTMGDADAEAAGFSRHSSAVWRTGIQAAVLGRAYTSVLTVAAGMGILCVLYVGGHLALAGQLQLGTLVALTQYATRSYQPITSIATTRMRILTAAVALNRVEDFVDREPDDLPRTPTSRATPAGEATLVFDDVWFRYPVTRIGDGADVDGSTGAPEEPAAWALRRISFQARPGTKLAIVGRSGAGKSTIGYLASGLFRPDRGTVRLGDTPIVELSPIARRDGVALVTQEAHLLSGTLIDNVRYGRPGATDDDVVDACRAAGMDDYIQTLPRKYETTLGERGYRLSGGQRQRLAIARVFLSRCPIVILDEATSQFESAIENAVQRELMRRVPGRALIVIAHRLSSVADADEIVVLGAGSVAERGRDVDLRARSGQYTALFRAQQRA